MTAPPPFRRVFLLGTGLIGGSLALDLREKGLAGRVAGHDEDPGALSQALARGVLDEALPPSEEHLAGSDLVILAVPVLAMEGLIRRGFPPGTLVTDVGSVKSPLVAAFLEGREKGSAWTFVPGHPIAGDEKSGPASARRGLFSGKYVLLTPPPGTPEDALGRVEGLWEGVGARVERMDAGEHDRIFAWVSHLPHMAAYALVAAVLSQDPSWLRFSGGGLRDTTRIAASSPRMWAEIAVSNRVQILPALLGMARGIETLAKLMAENDREGLMAYFARAAEARRKTT